MSTIPLFASSSLVRVTAFLACIIFASVSEACFIRNCPKGGKRSLETAVILKRECLKCGPGSLGQCVGPNICCSPHFGCHINTQETEVCLQENTNLTPCFLAGDVCGTRDSGNCVADGVCCDSDACALNERCRLTGGVGMGNGARGDVLKLLEKLLRAKDYD